jgi:branched-chain amino acid transport system substrate-binding protein
VAAAILAAAGCGAGAGGSGDGKKEYLIGFQGPLSGDSQQLGINMLGGAKAAVEVANRRGDLPFTIRLVTSDDQGTPEGGPIAAQKLIDNPDVIAVVGPVFSGATKASEPLFSQTGVLSISPSATNPALTSLGFQTFYRVVAPDTVQGTAAADYAAKVLGAATVFSLDDRSEYGTGLSRAFETRLGHRDVRVVHDGINPTKDYTSQATKIIGEHPDVVFYAGYYSEFALLVKALRDKGYTGNVMAGDGANDDQLVAQAGRAAEGVFLSCACGDANTDPKMAGFVADFGRANNNTKPGTYSGEAYDATNAVIDVLRRQNDGATRESVTAAFGAVDIEGITKRIRFTPNGEVEDDTVYIYQVKDGKRIILGPTSTLLTP